MLEKNLGQKIERKKVFILVLKTTQKKKKGKHFSSTFALFCPSYLLQHTLVSWFNNLYTVERTETIEIFTRHRPIWYY